LLAGRVSYRGKGLRSVGQFTSHPVGIGKVGCEGRTECLYLRLDALPTADLLRVGLVF
jgi:hypothetical protein